MVHIYRLRYHGRLGILCFLGSGRARPGRVRDVSSRTASGICSRSRDIEHKGQARRSIRRSDFHPAIRSFAKNLRDPFFSKGLLSMASPRLPSAKGVLPLRREGTGTSTSRMDQISWNCGTARWDSGGNSMPRAELVSEGPTQLRGRKRRRVEHGVCRHVQYPGRQAQGPTYCRSSPAGGAGRRDSSAEHHRTARAGQEVEYPQRRGYASALHIRSRPSPNCNSVRRRSVYPRERRTVLCVSDDAFCSQLHDTPRPGYLGPGRRHLQAGSVAPGGSELETADSLRSVLVWVTRLCGTERGAHGAEPDRCNRFPLLRLTNCTSRKWRSTKDFPTSLAMGGWGLGSAHKSAIPGHHGK